MYRMPAAVSMAIAAVSFAGCGGAVGAPHPATNPQWAIAGAMASATRPVVRASSSLLPNGKNSALLYISNLSTGSVNVYGMPALERSRRTFRIFAAHHVLRR
jgi:hypothetical protein